MANQSILGGKINMIKILFVCHGSTADSRELAVLVGQNGANHGIWDSRCPKKVKIECQTMKKGLEMQALVFVSSLVVKP